MASPYFSNSFFLKVDVPSEEPEIKKMLQNLDCKTEKEYKVGIIGVKKFDKKLVNLVVDPVVIKLGAGDVALFFINGLIYFIELQNETGFELFDKCYLSVSGEIEIPIVEGEIAKDLLIAIGLKGDFVNYFIDFNREA